MKKNEDNFDVFVDKNIDKIKNNKKFKKKSNEWSLLASKIHKILIISLG